MRVPLISIIFFCLIWLTSCFEAIEEVNLEENGEGDFKVTLNLSKSKGEVKKLLALDTLHGNKVPKISDIKYEIDKVVSDLNKIEGVSKAESKQDYENFILSINYHFRDVETLNQSIREILKTRTVSDYPIDEMTFFSYEDNVFERHSDFDFNVLMHNVHPNVKILETSSYMSIYRFNNSVSSTSNNHSKISKSGKAVMNRISAARLIKNHLLIHNKITQ